MDTAQGALGLAVLVAFGAMQALSAFFTATNANGTTSEFTAGLSLAR